VTEDYVVDDADKLLEVKVGGSAVNTYGYDAAGRNHERGEPATLA
jgi:hypothetical protein